MAIEKGLRFVDSSLLDRYSLTIDQSTQSFFESNSPTTAYGAMVLTIRPAAGDANDNQALIVGDNLVVGIGYNAAGDQYRLLLQDAVNYDSNAFSTAHNTVFSRYASVDDETTFAFNWNANGTINIAQTDEALRTKSMTPWTVQNQSMDITIPTPADGEDFALVLDDGKGSIAEVGYANVTGTAANVIASDLKDQIDALDAYTATVTAATITVTRSQGGSFEVSAGNPANLGLSGTDKSATMTAGPTGGALAALPQGEKGGSIGIDPNFDGFISQIVEFGQPVDEDVATPPPNKTLDNLKLKKYVGDPTSVPEVAVTAGQASKAVVTVTAAAEDFVLKLDDGTGNFTDEFKSDGGSTAGDIYTELEAAFNNLNASQKAGFTVEAITNTAGTATHLDISREDGADFRIESVDGTGTDHASGAIIVNGVGIDVGGQFISSTVGASSIDVVVGSDNKGENYQIVLDDGAGNQNTVSHFSPTANSTAANVAAALATDIQALTGYSASSNTDTVTISRSDGKAFKIKRGIEDEADDLTVDGVALTLTPVTAKNDSVDGVTASLSNGVKQHLDFTTLSNAIEVVGADPNGEYAGEATLSLQGIKLDDGTLATLVGGSTTVTVSSSSYDGGGSGQSGGTEGQVASDAVFTQIRNVEGAAGTRKMFVDVFVNPEYVTDGQLKSLSYDVEVGASFDILDFKPTDAADGYSFGSENGSVISARWFSNSDTGLTDLTDPIATIELQENQQQDTPSFEFSNVEVNGEDLTDDVTYTDTFTQTLDAALVDVSGSLVSGLDNETGMQGHYVLGTGAPGATSAAPTPANGVYLEVASWTYGSPASGDVTYTFDVKTASSITTGFAFDLDLPGQTTMASVIFTPTSGVTADTNAVTGRTLEVAATASAVGAGSSLGSVTVTLPGEFGNVQYFKLANVTIDDLAANGRGLYAGITETDASGAWTFDDMPAGLFNRVYKDGPAVELADISGIDAFNALQVSADLEPHWYALDATEGQIIASDFDLNGEVNSADALAIMQYINLTQEEKETSANQPIYRFFQDAPGTDATITDVNKAKALTTNHVVATSDLVLTGQNDRVVLVGDLSDPSV